MNPFALGRCKTRRIQPALPARVKAGRVFTPIDQPSGTAEMITRA
jgi:hypothetical protein